MFFQERAPSQLESAMDRAFTELKVHEVNSEEYSKIVDQIISLHKMKEEEKPSPVSKDTLFLIGANLLGIVMIIKHEHVNVITSRAMNLVLKPR